MARLHQPPYAPAPYRPDSAPSHPRTLGAPTPNKAPQLTQTTYLPRGVWRYLPGKLRGRTPRTTTAASKVTSPAERAAPGGFARPGYARLEAFVPMLAG